MDMSIEELDKEMDSIRCRTSIKSVADGEEERMLLSKSSGQIIADYLDVPQLAAEVERAVWQVEKALKNKQELKDEKAELDAAITNQLERDR